MKNEVGMAGSKSIQTRDMQILYIPMLAFLDYYAPINFNAFVECGIWDSETFRGCSLVFMMVWVISFDSIALLLVIFAALKKQA